MAIPMPITEILPEEIMSHVKEANESDDEDKEEDGYDDDETEEKIPDIEEELLKLYEKDNQGIYIHLSYISVLILNSSLMK